MAQFNVRVFGYRGVSQMTDINPKQLNTSQVNILYQPYEWSQVLVVTANSINAVSSAAVNNDAATLIRIEVPDGQTVRYEINPPQRSGGQVAAGNLSPAISGRDQYYWTTGATLSVVDAAAFP